MNPVQQKKEMGPHKNLRVLLINPFVIFSDNIHSYDYERVRNKSQFIDPSLGLEYISVYIKKHLPQVAIEVYDANAMAVEEILLTRKVDMDHLYSKVEKYIGAYDPDVIGITALFEFIGYMANKFADLAKNIKPDVKVVLGGAYASFSYSRALKNDNIDFIINGEGEESFRQLLSHLEGKMKIEEVESLIYRNNSKDKIEINRKAAPINVNELPIIERNDRHMESYATRYRHAVYKFFPERASRVASVLCTRGCPYACGFCSTRLIWGHGIRLRTLDSIFEEINMLIEKYRINTFFFPDDNIFFNREFLTGFLTRFIRLKETRDLKWICGGIQVARVLDPKIIKLCVESGLVFFNPSFESGSERTLRAIKKPITLAQSEEFMGIIRDVAPEAYVSSSWIVGLPFETMEDFELTYHFAKKLGSDWSIFSCYQPYPGTAIYDECVKKGYVDSAKDNVVIPSALLGNAITTENFSACEVAEFSYRANLDLNFLNNRNLRGRGRREYALRDFRDITTVYPEHVFGFYCLAQFYKEENDPEQVKKYLSLAREAQKRTDFYDKNLEHFKINLFDG